MISFVSCPVLDNLKRFQKQKFLVIFRPALLSERLAQAMAGISITTQEKTAKSMGRSSREST